jgi:hypothetical protein
MPVDNLGQTFRFIVEQAGGGGGDGGTSGGGAGGAAASSTRQSTEMRRMMDKMVKAVDTTEKTTQNAFTKGFKTLGLQLTFANMLKQSQVFTGTLNAIFQVVGALIDITLAPFMPLIVKFLQKAIPRLLDFAEKMGNWVRGELAQLDELGLTGYIWAKLTSIMEDGLGESFRTFGVIVAGAMGTITKVVVSSIPETVGIAIRALGVLMAEVMGSAVTKVGILVTTALGNVVEWVGEKLASVFDYLKMTGVAENIRKLGKGAGDSIKDMGEAFFVPMGESVSSFILALTEGAATIMESDFVKSMFDTVGETLGQFVEGIAKALFEGVDEGAKGLADTLRDIIPALDGFEDALTKNGGTGDGDTVEPKDRTVGVDPIVKRLWGGNIGMDNEMGLEMGVLAGKGLSWGASGGKDAASQLEDSFAHELEYGLRSYNPDLSGVWGQFVPLEAVEDLNEAQKTSFDSLANAAMGNMSEIELAQNIHKYGARNLDKYGNPKSFDALMADDSLDALKGLSWGETKNLIRRR